MDGIENDKMSEGAVRVKRYGDRSKTQPSFWKLSDGTWNIFLPDERVKPDWDGVLGALANHSVEEHDDGTISVTPSIFITDGCTKIERHGYLTQGVWSECQGGV